MVRFFNWAGMFRFPTRGLWKVGCWRRNQFCMFLTTMRQVLWRDDCFRTSFCRANTFFGFGVVLETVRHVFGMGFFLAKRVRYECLVANPERVVVTTLFFPSFFLTTLSPRRWFRFYKQCGCGWCEFLPCALPKTRPTPLFVSCYFFFSFPRTHKNVRVPLSTFK